MIQPKDAGIMVEIVNAVSIRVRRPIQFFHFHLPVPKPRTDDASFAPPAGLNLHPETELYRPSSPGRHGRHRCAPRRPPEPCPGRPRNPECGMARADPARFPELLAAHAETAELASG